MKILCPNCNWPIHSETSVSLKCGNCRKLVIIGDPALSIDPPRITQGRAAWIAIHTMQAPTADKLTAWLDTVPSYSCKCREFATQYIKDNPPHYDDPVAFFEWAWRFHDTVDQKTGDQRMTLEEARAFWHDERTRQAALPVPSLSGGHPTIASVDTPRA